jgi:Flp pilus assembly protein CpaB
MRRKGVGLPVALGVLTGILLALVLWPKAPPQQTVVVAARDLGAGMALTAADLTTATLPASQAPTDAVSDPAALVGQTLAVVRFAGEPVTPRHLGPAVTLAPDERGIAVQVQVDTGLAGLLRPGMTVGVVATLAGQTPDPADSQPGVVASPVRTVYAKALLEGVRVLYVPPEFQARPYTPLTAAATVSGGQRKASSGLLADQPPAASPATVGGTVREGVIVLAASTQPVSLTYQLLTPAAPPITATLPLSDTRGLLAAGQAPGGMLAGDLWRARPVERLVVPVELLAALNASDAAFTLVLAPENAAPYTTAGLSLADLAADVERARPTPVPTPAKAGK